MSQPWRFVNGWNGFSLSNILSRMFESQQHSSNVPPSRLRKDQTSQEAEETNNGRNGESFDDNTSNNDSTHWKWSLHVGDEATCTKDGKYSWNLASHFKHC